MRVQASLACLFLLVSSTILAQESKPKEEAKPGTSLKIETSIVLVDAAVVSKRTKGIVGDLKREDFAILDNGRKQEITHFSSACRKRISVRMMMITGCKRRETFSLTIPTSLCKMPRVLDACYVSVLTNH